MGWFSDSNKDIIISHGAGAAIGSLPMQSSTNAGEIVMILLLCMMVAIVALVT